MLSFTKSFAVIALLLSPMVARGFEIPNLPDCNICFSALPEGCKDIMKEAKTSTKNGLRAMTECICTDEYFTVFSSCAGCSAKIMGVFTKSPTEEDFKQTKDACTKLLEYTKAQSK
ncbi:hypothetical protein K493DRAFT_313362 [Basidiobolus meristosporus CBS 931.73]|uniref:Uncharacterized protein n=1 Tax=Basidiobolus meristosporus CBS 931.73 TaxID=1314790 RepID=A0A1Y1YM12_9FUNG|nr:hypothetical protein K493DRAFT_313362 [Basidiobolus meristosporus CBS 931.73]|eukprot:ORX99047.1 hypothetical protein K493DRAFT_313362 [Basidiobolus meristosporus CBS 931.73]